MEGERADMVACRFLEMDTIEVVDADDELVCKSIIGCNLVTRSKHEDQYFLNKQPLSFA